MVSRQDPKIRARKTPHEPTGDGNDFWNAASGAIPARSTAVWSFWDRLLSALTRGVFLTASVTAMILTPASLTQATSTFDPERISPAGPCGGLPAGCVISHTPDGPRPGAIAAACARALYATRWILPQSGDGAPTETMVTGIRG